MKILVRGASRAALLAGVAVGAPAFAQTPETIMTTGPQQAAAPAAPAGQAAPARVDQEAKSPAAEKVTVTGSFIATAPEDAPKPIEVHTAAELEESGSPNITEFVRSLTSATPNTTGSAFTNSGAAILGNGFVSVDLRGQGANGTLVLMNGRRLASTNGGAGADVNTIPMQALGAVEVLKDGASSTYGAGAVGGVINFKTRRDINAPQVSYTKTFYDNSGVDQIDLMTGWVGDASNVLLTYSHTHEGSLMANERDFSHVGWDLNPNEYSLANTSSRMSKWTNYLNTATVGASFNDLSSNANCAAVGGALFQDLNHGATGSTTPTACTFSLSPVTELVSESTQDQIYGEFNGAINERMEFHFDSSWSKYDSSGKRPPSGAYSAGRAMDAAVATLCAATCTYLVPASLPVYTTAGVATTTQVANPFVADFNARQPGTTNDVANGDALLTSVNWRPVLFGGNPLWDDGLARSRVQRERFLVNAGFKGEFGGDDNFFGKILNGVHYDIAGQYNQYVQTNVENGDWLVDRLQDALMGYGGPDCKAVDRVRTDYTSAASYNRTVGVQSDTAPGTNGCQWFNPFQSQYQTSIFNGATNPDFPTGTTSPNWLANGTQASKTGPQGFINDKALIDWLWATRRSEIQYQALTFDALLTGEVPGFELPGGKIGWALGSQWRQTERRGGVQEKSQAELKLLLEQCPYGQASSATFGRAGCTTTNGIGDFFAGATPIQPNPGLNPPDFIDSQTLAYFGELQIPVLDNLNFSASLRKEDYNGGKISGTIWGVAGKWNITDDLYIRGSYGTNFRAEAVLDAVPGATTVATATDTSTSRFGTFTYNRITTTVADIAPEDDKTMNIGVGYSNRDLFGARFRAQLDYFDITVTNAQVTTSATTVLANVFHQDNSGPNPETDATRIGNTNFRADCSARLVNLIAFTGGSCVQGTTTGASIAAVLSNDQNGPGLTTKGIEYSVDISYPLFDGDIGFNFQATKNLTYKADPYSVNGVVFDAGGDRLGFFNGLQSGSPSQKFRANANIRWSNKIHSFTLAANYQSGYNRDPGTFDVSIATAGANAGKMVATTTLTPIINGAGTCIFDGDSTHSTYCPTGDVYSTYGLSNKDYIDYDFTYIFKPTFMKGLQLRASVLNLLDRDPVGAQYGNGGTATTSYIPQLGNPRGRRIELAVTKKF